MQTHFYVVCGWAKTNSLAKKFLDFMRVIAFCAQVCYTEAV